MYVATCEEQREEFVFLGVFFVCRVVCGTERNLESMYDIANLFFSWDWIS